jgi:hypothetical protein
MKPTTVPGRRFGRLRWNQDYADIAMAAVVTAIAFGGVAYLGDRLDFLGGILLALQTLPIAWRRRDPMRILITTGLAITACSALGYPVHRLPGRPGLLPVAARTPAPSNVAPAALLSAS